MLINFPLKKIRNDGNQIQGCWARSEYATTVLCSPPNFLISKLFSIVQILDPVSTTGLTTENLDDLMEQVRNQMLAVFKEDRIS